MPRSGDGPGRRRRPADHGPAGGQAVTSRATVAVRLRSVSPAGLVLGGVLVLSIAAFFRVPLLPTIGRELSMNPAQLAAITTAFAIGRLVTDIPAGRLADRQRPMAALAFAGALLALASTGMAMAPSGVWVVGAAGVLGIASAMTNTTGMTFFSRSTGTAGRGAAMARFSAALLGGQAIGPTLGGVVGGAAGWRLALVCAAGVGVVVAVVLRLSASDADRPLPAAGAAGAAVGSSSPPALARPAQAALYAIPFTAMFTLGAMPQTLVPIIGDASYGLSPARIGLVLGLGGLCRFIGVMVGGRVSDRVSRKASLVPGLVLFSGGVAILAFDAGAGWWVAAVVAMSLGSYGISVAATILGDVSRGSHTGRRLGSFRFIGDVGLIAGPTVAGLTYERFGLAPAVLLVAGLLLASAIAAQLLLPETRWVDR